MSTKTIEVEMDKSIVKTFKKIAKIVNKPMNKLIEFNLKVDLKSIFDGIKYKAFGDVASYLNMNDDDLSLKQRKKLLKLSNLESKEKFDEKLPTVRIKREYYKEIKKIAEILSVSVEKLINEELWHFTNDLIREQPITTFSEYIDFENPEEFIEKICTAFDIDEKFAKEEIDSYRKMLEITKKRGENNQ